MPKQQELQKVQNTTVIGEIQIINAIGELFNHVDNGLSMWSGAGDRKVSMQINFKTSFANPPAVTIGVTGMDSAHDQNLRFWLSAKDITEKGFTIEFDSWGDTHIARAAISWTAIGKRKPYEVKTTSASTIR
ncbi:H-type lectin domain-containing protein [Paracoccus sp. KR1-242]|uniref:H-type lectin domain-containing protein n=1 Tax=Paracoccus sp. KR1-242 TaxID=3410028 RepID=UPI003C09DF02